MYICLCAGVTDRQIRELCAERVSTTFPEVCRRLNVARQCGRCAEAAKAAAGLDKKSAAEPASQPGA
jgi:bacterioferritin-associated ferredoxin